MFYNYWGKCSSSFYNVKRGTEIVAQSIYYDFPEAFDRKLSIGDACPIFGNCSGHPGNSHGTNLSFDLNYYVIGDYNTTQYRDSRFRPEGNFVHIWKNNKEGTELIPGVFDVERNFLFAARMKQIFPERIMFTNDVLHAEILTKLDKKYSREEMNLYWKGMSTNAGTQWNHHTHYHFTAHDIEAINWDFDIRDFVPRR